MPIYEYLCKKCNKTYEIMHKHDDQTKIVCGVCLERLEKQVSLSSFRLKGGGWMPHKKGYFGEGLD